MKPHLFLTLLLSTSSLVSQNGQLPLAKGTVTVVEDGGVPIKGAEVKMWFKSQNSNESQPKSGLSDQEGRFSAEGYITKRINVEVTMDGYYPSYSSSLVFKEIDNATNRWLPWNLTDFIVMRRVKNPIPMYAKCAVLVMPVADTWCGYDLMRSDWVVPHGRGESADLLLKLTRRFVDRTDFSAEIDVKFPGTQDGIQEIPKSGTPLAGSAYAWPYEAPLEGYGSAIKLSVSRAPGKGIVATEYSHNRYVFRVRSGSSQAGLSKALCGKIMEISEPTVFGYPTAAFRMTYYLNPNPADRNIEWDPKRNLFIGLAEEDTPRRP